MTDPISDMITRLRNASIAKHTRVDMPASKLKAEIARILQDEGYIQGFRIVEEAAERAGRQPRQVIRMFLKYGPHGEKVISGLERISRPGRRVYLAGYLGGLTFYAIALKWLPVAHPMMYLSWAGLAPTKRAG